MFSFSLASAEIVSVIIFPNPLGVGFSGLRSGRQLMRFVKYVTEFKVLVQVFGVFYICDRNWSDKREGLLVWSEDRWI